MIKMNEVLKKIAHYATFGALCRWDLDDGESLPKYGHACWQCLICGRSWETQD